MLRILQLSKPASANGNQRMDVNQGGAEGHIHAWRRMRIFLMRQTGLRPIELLTAVNIV